MTPATLFLAQRLTALILAPLVLVHLVLILIAVEGGLSAAEILDRTRGSVGWAAFYGLFVLAAAISLRPSRASMASSRSFSACRCSTSEAA